MFRIKEMRNRARMTQKQVAEALGIKRPRYGDWERGTTTPNLKDAINMADLFRCTLDELAGRDFPAKATPALSPDEAHVVDAMRSTDERGRGAIISTAEYHAGMEGQSEAYRRAM